jgi:tRNA (cmo5U34)-methyltransferase
MEVSLGRDFDVCVAALAIHHQDASGKQELFRRIHAALAPGGRFLMIDWTRFKDPGLQELSFRVAETHLKTQVTDRRIVEEWAEHWRHKNRPETLDDLTSWLHAASFGSVECVVRFHGMALICAEKTASADRA